MGRFTKRIITGLAAALTLAAGGAYAQTSWLDNFEDGNNRNMFGDYWFFFDDSKERSAYANVTTVPLSPIHSADVRGTGDDKELLFVAKSISDDGANASEKSAILDFEWGPTFWMPYDNSNPERARNPTFADSAAMNAASCKATYVCGHYYFSQFVGIGTNLVEDGAKEAPKGFENATSLKFWAKGTGEAKAIWVFFEQSDIGWYPDPVTGPNRKAGADFGQWVPITEAWAEYEVPLEEAACSRKTSVVTDDWKTACTTKVGLRQPDWVANHGVVGTFNKSKVVKVQFQIQTSDGSDPWSVATAMGNANSERGPTTVGEAGKLWLDDIRFEGFEFVAHDMCMSCIKDEFTPGSDDAKQLDQFAEGHNQNTLGQYWYFYDDTKAKTDNNVNGNSTMGVEPDEKNCNSEYVNEGECEAVIQGDGYLSGEFALGDAILIDGETVDPFVGIGTNLYDDKAGTPVYFNGEGKITGLSFKYKTDYAPRVSKVTFEVSDKYDADSSRPVAAVRYTDLPVTNGEWFTAVVPFSALVQHTGWQVVKDWNAANPTKAAFQNTALAKFQWKIQDGSGTDGILQLKDVWMIGTSDVGVKLTVGNKKKATGLRATYNRGVVGVNWNAAQSIASGKVSLVNVKGRTVASANLVKAGGKVTANLGKGKIPTGMYFVRINAKDVQGKRVVQQVPLSIVK